MEPAVAAVVGLEGGADGLSGLSVCFGALGSAFAMASPLFETGRSNIRQGGWSSFHGC